MATNIANIGADYDQLVDDMRLLGCLPSAAEYHGLVCGRLAANRQVQDPAWRRQSLDYLGLAATKPASDAGLESAVSTDADAEAALTRVLGLPAGSGAEMNDADLGFHLWIPGDDMALEQRLVALGEWCSGFLLGLAWGGLNQADWDVLSTELGEGLSDLVAISGVDELGDGDEADFMQLYEYVRMVALNVSAEVLLSPAPDRAAPDAQVQHSMSHLFGAGETRH